MEHNSAKALSELACIAILVMAGTRATSEPDDPATKATRIAWFNEARFGMFIHWGPFAVHSSDPNTTFDYFDMKQNAALRDEFKKYAAQFHPTKFDPAKWMSVAKDAGMKYVVFTSKHHDGYAMFSSALSDYDSMDGAPKRDFVRELIPAARKAGLKIGFYYSMLDWNEPDYVQDLPTFVDRFLFGQVRELCANYGPIDCVWFDGEWDHPLDAWRSPDLVKMIRDLQPDTLINDRLGKGERGITRLADFYTREQPDEMNVAMDFERKQPYSWEACMTIGDYWQYSIKDKNFKTTEELIHILVDVVSRGGNLLLNVGPNPDGEIPDHFVERLHGIGKWMAVNGESIYGTTGSPFVALPAGKCTTKGNRLYVHLFSHPGAPIQLPGLQNTIKKAVFLDGGQKLDFDNAAKTITVPPKLPNAADTVIVLELDAPPQVK